MDHRKKHAAMKVLSVAVTRPRGVASPNEVGLQNVKPVDKRINDAALAVGSAAEPRSGQGALRSTG